VAAHPDVLAPPIKATALRKPPPRPPAAPPKYGVIRKVLTDKIKDGLEATFIFSPPPLAHVQLQTTWYYNNKPIGQALKNRRSTVTSSVRSSSELPAGYWRCALRVKLPSGEWRELQEARVRLR
jgi:hypothetical protein